MKYKKLTKDIELAQSRVKNFIRETPLEYSPYFSDLTGANVWFKLENIQLTGSFKIRGAYNKLLCMTEKQRAKGCVAASSGNHGAAVSYAMNSLGIKGIIFVPEHTSTTKVAAISRFGSEVSFFGTDGLDTENHARKYALDNNLEYLSPYNDIDVICGQGTCGIEITNQLPKADAVFIAVGGGGLISGVSLYLKSFNSGIRIVSCQPEASALMTESVNAGKILHLPSKKTLSDGTVGGIESEAITFQLCSDLVDSYVVVSEEDIGQAMRSFIDSHHMLIEGAAGVAIAGCLAKKEEYLGKNIVVIICGGNISRETLKQVI